MKTKSTSTIFLAVVLVLFGLVCLVSCGPDNSEDTFKLVVVIIDEKGSPVKLAKVQLILPDNEIPPLEMTDDLGTCYFFIRKSLLDQPATIRVLWDNDSQSHTQAITLSDKVKTIQVKSNSSNPSNTPTNSLVTQAQEATSTATLTTATPTETSTPTNTPTHTPTITITPSYTPTRTPISPTFTPINAAFTPYPPSRDIISPNTRNALQQLAIWRAESAVYSLSISPDGKFAASGEQNGKVVVRDISTGTPLYTLNYGSAVLAVAFSPDGQWLVAGGSGRNILVWSAKNWSGPIEIGQHNGKVTSLSFSPDGKLLASGGYEDKTVKLWQVGESWALSTIINVPQNVNEVVFSPDNNFIAVAANDIYPRVWDRQGVFRYQLTSNFGPQRYITSLAFSPDSSVLVTGSRDLERCLLAWDVQTQKIKNSTCDNLQIESIAFSPGGELVATVDDKHQLTIWRVSNLSKLRTMQNYHQDLIYSIVFSPDGKLLLTASRDRTIRVWGIE